MSQLRTAITLWNAFFIGFPLAIVAVGMATEVTWLCLGLNSASLLFWLLMPRSQ